MLAVSDPLMPAERRFPRDSHPLPVSDEPPSAVRPFVLRGAPLGGAVREGKHRTPASRVPRQPIEMTTSDGRDNQRQVPDPIYVPDD